VRDLESVNTTDNWVWENSALTLTAGKPALPAATPRP
jgi:hypothetical protein